MIKQSLVFYEMNFFESVRDCVPQIRFALSRGFENGGEFLATLPRAALGARARPPSLTLGYYRLPLQGFQDAASPTVRKCVEDAVA
jgi:hypothetical protein